jgi:putative membrane protein
LDKKRHLWIIDYFGYSNCLLRTFGMEMALNTLVTNRTFRNCSSLCGGFYNASYDRMWEARKAWGAIVNGSRSWGIMVKDFVTLKNSNNATNHEELRLYQEKLITNHFAWLTALRHQLREARVWEAIYKKHNQEYKDKWFSVHEHKHDMKHDLLNYLSEEELIEILSKTNKATHIIAMQSGILKELLNKGFIEDFRHMEMQKMLVEFYNQQGVSERIKNFPYPRQYATLNL